MRPRQLDLSRAIREGQPPSIGKRARWPYPGWQLPEELGGSTPTAESVQRKRLVDDHVERTDTASSNPRGPRPVNEFEWVAWLW